MDDCRITGNVVHLAAWPSCPSDEQPGSNSQVLVNAQTADQQLVVTSLTGQPALILPNGFHGEDAPPAKKNEKGEIEGNYGGPGTPVSLTFLAPLYREAGLLAFARAYQEATGFHMQHPKLTA